MKKTLADKLIEIDAHLVSLAKMRKPNDFEGELNQLIQDFDFEKNYTPTSRPPETCTDFSNLTLLQREIYGQFLQLQRQEKMDPKNNDADKLEFLEKFLRDTCVLSADQKRQLEGVLVEYHDVFAKRCLDVGYNT